jgi:hypothetical protein
MIWENRIYCLSHAQYPVMIIRLEEGTPSEPVIQPIYPRFTLLAIYNWDVMYKDEWNSAWTILGTPQGQFAGQKDGYRIEVVQRPQCTPATEPDAVMRMYQEMLCLDATSRDELKESLAIKHSFSSALDYEIQKMWMVQDETWAPKLELAAQQGCLRPGMAPPVIPDVSPKPEKAPAPADVKPAPKAAPTKTDSDSPW